MKFRKQQGNETEWCCPFLPFFVHKHIAIHHWASDQLKTVQFEEDNEAYGNKAEKGKYKSI